MTYTDEERRTIARKALDWCWENHRTLSAYAKEQGRDLETFRRCVHAYYPEELGKYSNWKLRGRHEPNPRGFVPVTAVPRLTGKDAMFRISYLGAGIETDGEGPGTVLRAVRALSLSAL